MNSIVYVLPTADNRLCEGEGPIRQGQFCHYLMPDVCAPHAGMILERINISAAPHVGANSELCSCGFSEGKYVCLPRKLEKTRVHSSKDGS